MFLGVPDPSGNLTASLTINGRSWPYTERQVLPFGRAATWRVINASSDLHPMHLHGTFYTVESLGTYARDTLYDHDSRRLVTTEAHGSRRDDEDAVGAGPRGELAVPLPHPRTRDGRHA